MPARRQRRRAASAAQSLPRGVERVTSVEGITEYRLANGLQVLLFPDQSKQTITVNVTYKVGSRHEGYGETGMAHLLEHLVFKGSPRHRNIPQELTEHGSRPNGSTWFDRTNYFETFAATEENLRWALDLESDRMVNSFIAKADLDSEMTVVRNELESGENSPTNVLLERVLSTAYLWHNYGKSTIGSRSDLENVPIDRLQAFYRTYYQPDNAVLLVAGKFDEPKTLELISAVLRRHSETHAHASQLLHRRAHTGRRARSHDPSRRRRAVGDVRVPRAVGRGSRFRARSISSCWRSVTRPPADCTRGSSKRSRPARSSAADFQLHDPGTAYFAAQVRQDQSLDAARDGLLKIVEAIATTPPTAEELERARTEPADADRAAAQLVGPRGPAAERMDRHGRLAPALPPSRPPSEGDRRKMRGAWRRSTSSQAIAPSGSSSRRRSPIASRCRRSPTSSRC